MILTSSYFLSKRHLPQNISHKLNMIPIVHNGRVKPLDTFARLSILFLAEKQFIRFKNEKIHYFRWFLDIISQKKIAQEYPHFLIHNDEIKDNLKLNVKKKFFSFKTLSPHIENIHNYMESIKNVDSSDYTSYQKELSQLYDKLLFFKSLQTSFFDKKIDTFEKYLLERERHIPELANLFIMMHNGQKISENDSKRLFKFNLFFKHHEYYAANPLFLIIPTKNDNLNNWKSGSQELLHLMKKNNKLSMFYLNYAKILDAYVEDSNTINQHIDQLYEQFNNKVPSILTKSKIEYIFNQISPFYICIILYLLFFVYILTGTALPSIQKNTIITVLLSIIMSIHSMGLLIRMYLQNRPPVTNLYSSAIFVGWVAVLISLLLYKRFKNKTIYLSSSFIAFCSLIIAHHLSIGSDTLEMMQAVLDSNFWLSTHVITITIGYSGTFISGMLASIFILKGTLTKTLDKDQQIEFKKLVYGTLCFSLFFSVVGTILGGIWADQSWGRFWGWDPKENGALMIVLWIALIIHLRAIRFIETQGLMLLSVFGNSVTAFSWFGVNMLGVGLHSYGFMDKTLLWLIIFNIINGLIIAIGCIPKKYWLSKIK